MIRIEKTGTLDLDIVESNPVVFRGRPWLMEYVRQHDAIGPSRSYYGNALGRPYCRFRSLEDCQTFSEPFGIGYCFGNAFVDNDHIAVTVTERWGGDSFLLMESDDMLHWTEPRKFFSNPAFRCYNSSMCKADGKYINALEVGDVTDCLDNYMVFVESTDLREWRVIPGARADKGAPVLRHHDGWFFYMCLLGSYEEGFNTCIFRSRDLRSWEESPNNPILPFDEDDRKIHAKARLSPEQLQAIATAVNINASDMDMCDYDGGLVVSYSWGDQRGHEFLALGKADASERDFCFSWF